MIKLIINVITGKLRARKIGRRYGLSSQVISQLYFEFYIFSQANGLVPSMRGFEITLRKNLAEKIPDTKMIEPLYCKGLDPLNPYLSSDVNE